jgi:hypothetical protein
MKSLFFTTCLVIAFAFNAHSQKMASQLQSKTWYAFGTVGNNSPIILKTTQPAAKTTGQWEAKFSSFGRMSSCAVTNKDVVDMRGTVVKAGTFWCDSLRVYTVKNDMISIMEYDKMFYYKIKALPNSEGIELAPATKEEFK